jgi:flavin-dependent dehydrogenase
VPDVLIVGAGPAGSVAGTILARAGARVRIVDRATFPRDKLCGDTVNPGTLARLRALGLENGIDDRSLRVDGMRVTGERGVTVEGHYPRGLSGRAITRRELDWLLLEQAIAAGCEFESGVAVRRAIVEETRGVRSIGGVVAVSGGREWSNPARVTIAADGRHSTIAFALGLAVHPRRPRRWAIGAYFENFLPPATGCTSDEHRVEIGCRSDEQRVAIGLGEMHVRRTHYIGVAPVPGGLTNVCLVRPSGAGDPALGTPAALLTRTLAGDPQLRDRAAGARMVAPPVILGPLAVDVREPSLEGLLLAGDAAGFIDPITGDGLRFAVRGAELAAASALQALAHGWSGIHASLTAERRRAFGAKWRFNRGVRVLVASPRAVEVAGVGARFAPAIINSVIARAGDC